METFRAVSVGQEAARRLGQASGIGRVHSAFSRTVNIELGGLAGDGWLSLHGPGPLPAPFGIACQALPDVPGLQGAPVRVEARALVVGERLRVSLDGCAVTETALPESAPMPPVVACLERACEGVSSGLLPAVAAVLEGRSLPADSLSRQAARHLSGLLSGTREASARRCLAAALGLLGLGPGLTPSGDDVLVGWLAGSRTAGGVGKRLGAAVGPRLLEAAAARTVKVSHAFLAAAVNGQVAEPVRAFVLTPDAERLDGLVALGETSGADLLAGYLLARFALEARPAGSTAPGRLP